MCVAPGGKETMFLIPSAIIYIASYGTIAWQKPSRKWRCQSREACTLLCQSANSVLVPHRTFDDFLSGVVAGAGKQKGALFGELPTDVPQSNH